MRYLPHISAAIFITMIGFNAHASDLDVVKSFYSELLSNPTRADLESTAERVVTENWISIPTPRGGPDRAGFVKSLQGFGSAIPDLKWEPQEILQVGNRYIVRSIATGTPVKPFFGVEPSGNSFKIMSIDIHTVEDNLITRSYHVEEWTKAIQQLKAQ
ncbi:MAG: ester cyclase [Acidiferrobacterales bacterium]|nr:ester cyclase [Acidiferrobacterales bacterium]